MSLGIKNVKTVRVLTEAALIGGLNIAGRSEILRILSDGAGQFNVMQHGLCWVHIERGLRKLGISFWNYLTSRLHGEEQVLSLSDLIRAKAAAKIAAPT